eukprot:gene33093-42807_t
MVLSSQLGVLLCQSRFKNHLLLNLIPYNPTDVTEAFLPPTPVDSDFDKSPKLLQTHEFEVFFKSSKVKGLSVGVTVDPVRINNIREFASADGLAEKVLEVERAKDGVFEVEKIAASEALIPISTEDGVDKKSEVLLPVYDIEYKVDSSRGKNYYDIRTTVFDKKLYILTCQSKLETVSDIKDRTKDIISSFSIIQ